jgi:FKBP12-rapamycin complex-associated protein
MQLFKLINTLLNHQREAFSRNLHLLPYEVIPLSPSAGLLSWVPNTQQYVLLIPTLASDPGNDADNRLQSIITANRDRTHNAALSQKEMASMLGVRLYLLVFPSHSVPNIRRILEKNERVEADR